MLATLLCRSLWHVSDFAHISLLFSPSRPSIIHPSVETWNSSIPHILLITTYWSYPLHCIHSLWDLFQFLMLYVFFIFNFFINFPCRLHPDSSYAGYSLHVIPIACVYRCHQCISLVASVNSVCYLLHWTNAIYYVLYCVVRIMFSYCEYKRCLGMWIKCL